MKQGRSSNLFKMTLCALVCATGCDDGGADVNGSAQNLDAVCVASGVQTPAGAWVCPAPLSLECGAALPPIYVSDAQSCAAPLASVTVDATRLGTQAVRVNRANGELACETTLSITDSTPPVLAPKTLNLWPPNHKLHSISVEDCVTVTDACDPELRAEFIWASSDEPVDDRGDGHHAPDILFDGCERVQLRAERQGPKDGRVYKLGVRVVDRAGHAVESQCSIIVDHDQRGVLGADSGESYRIELNGVNGSPSCDGTPDEMSPPTPPTTPPATDAGTPPADAGSEPNQMFL